MNDFKNYVEDSVLFESYITEVDESELEELVDVLNECQERLDEFMGLSKAGEFLKKLSDKGDKKSEEIKKGAKEFAEKGKDVVKGMAKEAIDTVKKDAKEVAQSHKEIVQAAGKKGVELAKEAKDKFLKVSAQSREALKKMFKNVKDANEEQKKVIADIMPLLDRISDGKKSVSGADGLRVLAIILSSDASGEIPSYKAYMKKLEMLRTTPMLSSFKVSVKKA